MKNPFRVSTEEYFGNDFSIHTWRDKYCLTEREKNFPAYAFLRWAGTIAHYEKERQSWRNQWFWEFWEGWWRPAGSIMSGLGAEGGISLENCTTIGLNGDNLEEIFATGYRVSKAAAYRQGLGVDISKLRPKGAKIKNSAKESTGSINWMTFLNDIGKHVGQKGRIPAMLFSMQIKHPDILDFIRSKTDLKAIDHANISVQITDDFMEAYQEDAIWKTEFYVPENKETISWEMPARQLMRVLSESAVSSAEPGVQYIDTARKESTTDVFGFPIHSSNACSEKILPIDSGCLLGSINAIMFSNAGEKLKKVCQSAVRFLDNCISYELDNDKSPYPNQKKVISQLRELGLGVTNLHSHVLDLGYDTDLGMKKMIHFVKNMSKYSWQASIDLGAEKGNAPAFKNKNLESSGFFKRMIEEGLEFKTLRNIQNVSIAPTGSLSLTFPRECSSADSTGIEPIVGFYWWKRARTSGQYKWYFNIPDVTRKKLKESGVMDVPKSVEDPTGSIGLTWIERINAVMDSTIFKPAHHIDPLKKVQLMGEIAKWVDASISVTYNLPETATAGDVERIYVEGWKQGIKSIAVYRDKSREAIIEFDPPKTVERRGLHLNRSEEIVYTSAAMRPIDLPCDVYAVSVKGKKFTILVGLLNGKPYEVFGADIENLQIPSKQGIIHKAGSGKYDLFWNGTVLKNIGNIIDNDEYSDYTRMASMALRHGVPVDFLVEQLEKTASPIVSLGKAIARVLKHYVGQIYGERKTCSCGSSNLMFKEGCFICMDCGISKCG